MTWGEEGAMRSAERVAVIGTGLIGTSIAMAGARAGDQVRGFDADPGALSRAVERAGLTPTTDLDECVRGATIVFVCTPIPVTAELVVEALALAPDAVVSDVASVKSHVMVEVESRAPVDGLRRYVGGHPMGGSERSGPDHASPSVLDGVVWVVTPAERLCDGALVRVIRESRSSPATLLEAR